MTKFLLRQDLDGFSFTLEDSGLILLQSKRYARRNTCLGGICSVRKNVEKASLESETHPRFSIYAHSPGNYFFRLSASNGQNVAQSAVYPSKDVCLYAIEHLKRCISDAIILNEDGSEP